MKRFILAAAVLAAPCAVALPQGHYAGRGDWTAADGQSAPFDYDLTFDGDQVHGAWTFQGHTVPYAFNLQEHGKFFDVVVGETVSGTGYCYFSQCHYASVFSDNNQAEETWTVQGDHLYVIGSKTMADKKAIWSADLTKVSK